MSRRTVVQGAAWTIPVIAVAVGAPLAAASNTPTLTFTNGPYTVASCGTLGPVTLHLTSDGTAPDGGKTITVSLPDGLTWSDGTTAPKPFVTDASGNVTLTGIKAPALPDSYTITGTSSTGATAVTTVAVTGTLMGYQSNNTNSSNPTYNNSLPAGSTAVNGTGLPFYMSADGNLYYQGTPITTGGGVTSSWGDALTNNNGFVTYVQNGVGYRYDSTGGNPKSLGALPAGTTAVGGNGIFLKPNGDLIYIDPDTLITKVIASNVSSASGLFAGGNNNIVSYLVNGRQYQWSVGTGQSTPVDSSATPLLLPAGSTVISGNQVFLTPSGDLYFGKTKVPGIPAGVTVTSAYATLNAGNTSFITFVGSDGKAYRYNSSVPANPAVVISNVPAGTIAVAAVGGLLYPNGDLYYLNTLIAHNVVSAAGIFSQNNTQFINYVGAPSC